MKIREIPSSTIMFQYPQNKTNLWSKSILRAGDTAQQLRTRTALSPKDPACTSRSRASDTVFWFPQTLPACVYTNTHVKQNIHSNEIK